MRDPNEILRDINLFSKVLDDYKKELEEASKGFVQCKFCKQFFEEKSLEVSSYTKTQTETTLVDGGYGDDDRIAEVTRLHEIIKCPSCGKEISHKTTYLYSKNERRAHP